MAQLADSLTLTEDQKDNLKRLCFGTFTFVIVGPSQHGKTTFLCEIMGVKESTEAYAKIGTGEGSTTINPHVWTSSSTLSGVKVQFIDTPGLSDSRTSTEVKQNTPSDEFSDEAIKAKVKNFLKDNKPNCVMLFHKFLGDMTGVST